MSKEIIISVAGEQSRIAIVENGELVELYVENPDNVRTIGDIYLSRVRRILPGIRAAFVDIGHKQDAFLHFSDLSDNLPELIELSQGKVPEARPERLTKAPDDPAGNLETESAEEQLATARRREIKRSRGEGRGRGRGKAKAEPATDQPAVEAPATETPPAEATEEAKPRRRSRARKAEEPDAQETSPREASPREARGPSAPSILPPDDVEPPPGDSERAAAEVPPPPAEAEEVTEDRPRRRRGGRRRRGRGDTPPADAVEAVEAEEAPAAEAEPAGADAQAEAATEEAKPTRSRRKKKEEPQPEAEVQEQEEAPKRRRSRSRKAENDQAREGQPEGASRVEETGAAPTRPEPAAPAAEKPAEPVAEPASGPARPARSSRFVIDLTAKPGRAAPPRREEEEEEEEESSTSRRRRGSRKAGGGDRRRGKADGDKGKDSGGRSARNGTPDDDEDDDEGKPTGRTREGRPPETYLKQDQKLLVKIIKEPISAKGSRVSTDISLAGRFLVLIPAADYVAVSKKIESSKERRRLRALARSLLPEGYGLIVRTVAEGRDAKALDIDLQLLLKRWRKVEDQLKQKPDAPVRLYEDVNMVSSIIRDLFSEDYDRIVVDDPKAYRTVKGYVQAVAPQMAESVQLYKGKEPVFRANKIEKEVRAAFEPRVPLPGGGYLFVETTEAMHVVDVNSGRAGRGLSQEENALRVNLEAAREIAKQLRLRDLGGIICVDFIDMRSDSYRKKVFDELKREFKRDRAVTKLLPMSDFGVVEITRQRLRPSITTTLNVDDLGPAPPEEEFADVAEDPRAGDSRPERPERPERAAEGPQPTAAEVVSRLERWLAAYREGVSEQHRKRPIIIRVHPFLAAYLQRGIPSVLTRWKFKTWLNFRLDVDEAADPLAFSVRDEKSGKNLTRKYDPDTQG